MTSIPTEITSSSLETSLTLGFVFHHSRSWKDELHTNYKTSATFENSSYGKSRNWHLNIVFIKTDIFRCSLVARAALLRSSVFCLHQPWGNCVSEVGLCFRRSAIRMWKLKTKEEEGFGGTADHCSNWWRVVQIGPSGPECAEMGEGAWGFVDEGE